LPRSCSGVVLWSLRGLVGDLVELVQGSGAAAAEVVVEFGVDRVQLVVGVGAGLVREVGGPFDLAHRLGGGLDVRVGAGGHGRVDGRAEGGPLVGGEDRDRAAQHVGVGL